jgi:hypothetical protein
MGTVKCPSFLFQEVFMGRVITYLDTHVNNAFNVSCQLEYRPPRDQAAYLIKKALIAAGYLPSDTDTPLAHECTQSEEVVITPEPSHAS